MFTQGAPFAVLCLIIFVGVKILLRKWRFMMTFAKILLGVDNRRNKRKEKKGKGKKASDKYQDRIKKKHSAPII